MKLTIESMTYGADGLAHADNGKAVFVQGAVAGDTVEAEVIQDGKSFMRARTTEILEPSPDRIQPPCPFVGICGGCSWGNLSRATQLAAKEQNLRSTLERIAGHGDLQRAYDLARGHNRDERGAHAAATHDIDHGQAFNRFKAIGGKNGNAGHKGSFHRAAYN